jgi:hypothetical protein
MLNLILMTHSEPQGQTNRPSCGWLILTLIFMAAGLATLYFGYQRYQESKASETWPVASGTVVSSEVTRYRDGDDILYRADVAYEYVVNETNYTGDKIALSEMNVNKSRPESAQKIADRYPVGQQVEVHYDPADPGKAVLETGVKIGVWGLLGVGAFFLLLGLSATLVVVWTNLSER